MHNPSSKVLPNVFVMIISFSSSQVIFLTKWEVSYGPEVRSVGVSLRNEQEAASESVF